MKNTKKTLTAVLITAFLLTTATQTDAFAWSFKKAVKKAVSVVTKPIASLISPKINPLTSKIQSIIQDKIIKPVIKPLVNGIKEVVKLGYLLFKDPKAFNDEVRYLGYKSGIRYRSDREFVNGVSGDSKVRDALWLLREKVPNTFVWIKDNLLGIRIVDHLVGPRGELGGSYNANRGRVISLSRSEFNKVSLVDLAGLIAHEVSHLVDYYKDPRQSTAGWEGEFRADQIRVGVLDRLGVTTGSFHLDKPYQLVLKGGEVLTVTDEIKRWQPGDPSTGGYWSFVVEQKGTTSSGAIVAVVNVGSSTDNESQIMSGNNGTTDAKYIADVSDNQKVRNAFLLLKDKSPDIFNWVKQNLPARTKGNLQGVFVGDTRNTVQFIDEKQGRVMLSKDSVNSLSAVKLAGIVAHEVFHLVEYLDPSSIGRDRKFVQEYEADLIRAYVLNRLGEGAGRIIFLKDPYKKRINGMDLTITHEITAWGANGFTGNLYDAGYISLAGFPVKGVTTSGELVEISYGATSNSPATITDLIKNLYGGMANLLNQKVGSGAPVTKVTSGAAVTNQNNSPKTNLTAQYEVISKTITKKSINNLILLIESNKNSITLPPVGGPQGGIAPDVVNLNASRANAAVAAGGK